MEKGAGKRKENEFFLKTYLEAHKSKFKIRKAMVLTYCSRNLESHDSHKGIKKSVIIPETALSNLHFT